MAGACTGGGPDRDPEAFCRRVDRLAELVATAEAGPAEIGDVPAARALADDIATTAEALPAEAPEEIDDDARTLAGVTAALAGDLRDFYAEIAADPARAADPAFLSAFDPLTDERQTALEEAGAGVRPWVEEHCD